VDLTESSKARKLLFEYLDGTQIATYQEHKFILVEDKTGYYKGCRGAFAIGNGWEVYTIFQGKLQSSYHVWLSLGYSRAAYREDSLLAQYLLLNTNPQVLFNVGCLNDAYDSNVPLALVRAATKF
jgi:hypothetical protein